MVTAFKKISPLAAQTFLVEQFIAVGFDTILFCHGTLVTEQLQVTVYITFS